MIKLSLGRDHSERKRLPILRVLGYFSAAVAGLTRHAVRGNDQHNPGQPLHWARGKSMDHDECIVRHSLDVLDYQAWLDRNPEHPDREAVLTELEHEYDARVWRSFADSQEFYEKYRGAPVSPSSVLTAPLPLEPINREAESTATGVDFDFDYSTPAKYKMKMPYVVDHLDGTWSIKCVEGRVLSTHSSYGDAETCLRELTGAPKFTNTPGEAAELEAIKGTIKLVAVPPLGEPTLLEKMFGSELRTIDTSWPTLVDEPVAPMPDETLQRCGHMSRTKRVCTLAEGHSGVHDDGVSIWLLGT